MQIEDWKGEHLLHVRKAQSQTPKAIQERKAARLRKTRRSEVARMYRQGTSVPEIAFHLEISISTVRKDIKTAGL